MNIDMERRELQHTQLFIVSLCDVNLPQQTSSQRLLAAMARSCVLLPHIRSASEEDAQALHVQVVELQLPLHQRRRGQDVQILQHQCQEQM